MFLKIIHNKIVASLLLLLISTISITYYIILNDVSVTTLSFNHKDSFSVFRTEILKRQKVNAEFTAKENYLGIITIRFDERRPNDDQIIFRFKEKNLKKWQTETKYHAIQFIKLTPFPFGIPPIVDSKGKTYQIEIESMKGKHNIASGLKKEEPVLITSYQIPKEIIFQSPISLLSFLFKKVLTNFQSSDFVFTTIISFLPLIFFTFSLLFPINKHRLIYLLFSFVLVLMVLINIFFIKTSYLIANVIVATINIVLFSKTQINYKFINIFCLFGILCGLLLHWLRLTSLEYRVNLWTVTYIVDTFVYQLLNHIQISNKIAKS